MGTDLNLILPLANKCEEQNAGCYHDHLRMLKKK